MARCGCSGTCSCVISSGTNVTVTGHGTPNDPYVVSSLVADSDNVVRVDINQDLTPEQQAQGQDNLGITGLGAGANALTGWFHVDGYGADPTGVADSTTAIQAAFADANAAGGRVYGHGAYKTTGELVISHDNVEIYGDVAGHMRINYTGSGAAIKTSNAAIRRGCRITNVHVSCVTAGATGVKVDNGYRLVATNCKFESQAGTTGIAVDLVGSAAKSTYYNTFVNCDAWGSQDCYRLGDNVNGTRWFGGVCEGPGRAIHMRAPTTTMGTNTAVGLAISCEGTNTSGEIVRIGDAGDTGHSDYNSLLGCRIESSGATTIIIGALSWYNVISGGSIAGTTTITDSSGTVGAGLTTMVPSSALDWHFGRPVDSDSFTAGKGTANALRLQSGSIQAVGTGTDINVQFRPKGAGGVTFGAFAGDGTGGLLSYTGGATPALRAQLGGTVCCDLLPAVGGYSLRLFKSGEAGYRLRVLDTGVFNFGDGAGVYDAPLSRVAAGTLGTTAAWRVGSSNTAGRPSASTVGAGGEWYDTDLKKPIYSDGTSWADARGTVTPIQTKTANYNMARGDKVIVSNGSSITISLPDPTTVSPGAEYVVKNIHTTSATVNSQGTSKTLDGAASQSAVQWQSYTFVSDSAQWLII